MLVKSCGNIKYDRNIRVIICKIQIVLTLNIVCCLLSSTMFSQTDSQIVKHVKYLASEQLSGRFPGSIGDSLASDYIKKHFENQHIQPFNNNYYQYFTVPLGIEITPTNTLTIGKTELKLFCDFEPHILSSNGLFETNRQLVELPYSTLQTGTIPDTVANRWVVVDTENEYLPMERLRHIALKAKEADVIGIILLVQQNKIQIPITEASCETLHSSLKKKYISNGSNIFYNIDSDLQITKVIQIHNQGQCSIPILSVTHQAYRKANEENWTKMQFHKTLSVRVDIKYNIVQTRNILGMIKGTHHPGRYLVIGAHYDHLGMGGQGSGSRQPFRKGIHYGADDNASGVAAVLELATTLAKTPLPISVMFAIFGAEEIGLLGSRNLLNNLPIENDSIIAMLNYDMVGRMRDNTLYIEGVTTAKSFKQTIDTITTHLNIITSPYALGPSDHATFYRNSIPILHLNTGTHIDYHTPDDTPEKINYNGIRSIISYSETLIRKLFTKPTEIVFNNIDNRKRKHAVLSPMQVEKGTLFDVMEENTGLRIIEIR